MEQRIPGWSPQPRQAQALACPAFELFFGGAKGGGKSDLLLGDFLQGIELGEAWKGIVFRRTYPELEEIQGRAQQIYGAYPGAEWLKGERTWTFPGGATLRFRHLASDQDVGNYQGHQYSWIGFDELSEFPTPAPYIFMLSCARSALGAPCSVRSTGNPGRPGHGWIKARFIDITKPFQVYVDPETTLTRCFIPSRLEDNTILMRNDPEYEKRLLLLPAHLRKAFRLGDWDVVVGQVFSEYREKDHVIQIPSLDKEWHRFVSMDWGYARPFSLCWWAVSGEGRLILYKEWYGCTGEPNVGLRMGAGEVASKAWQMSVNEGAVTMVADPACWSKTGASDTKGMEIPSIAESFEAAGFKMVKAVNDRVNGLQKIHEMLQTTGFDGRPMLLISELCRDWRRTVPLLTSDPRNPEDINTELEDHAYDATRYSVMSEYVNNPRALRIRPILSPARVTREYDPLRLGL
jgi:hypothetical protein